ncbi:hypothetical protein [Variovorax sp. RA8]|uniref:hypothetical protein n=1 Tax=Variovorax sp. (strain JCM 16519 / RA8) TaxID=662548 RepID=UPI000B09595C|nr:hypothetical protein [Variovorax sp. RA8]VTU34654.1 hypothetical protein RA8CHR_05016 [Variovorax sp. RA8]
MNEIKSRKPDEDKVDVPYLINLKRDQKAKIAVLKKKGFNIQVLMRNRIDELFEIHGETEQA